MATSDYHFITKWRIEGTLEEINAILNDALDLPRWWTSVYLAVEILEPAPPNSGGVGQVVGLHTKGWLPYTLKWNFKVTESRYPYGFTLVADGDFVGRGIWTFEQDGDFVNIVYDWKIRADKPLLRNFSWLFKPIFSANHKWAMRQGEESLKKELLRRHGAASSKVTFAPDQLADYEAKGWEEYYNHHWLKFFWLITQMGKQQFHFPLWRAFQASYYIGRASVEWAKKVNRPEMVKSFITRYYRLARRYSGMSFDPTKVAALEVEYWDVHRRLIGQADKTEFIETLIRLHSALFGLTPEQALPSAESRVLAANVVDEIVHKTTTNLTKSWADLRLYLYDCYSSIKEEVEKSKEVSRVS